MSLFKKKNIVIIILFVFFVITSFLLYLFWNPNKKEIANIPFLKTNSPWVDSLLKVMSVEDKIASIFFYDAGKLDGKISEILAMLKKYRVGGILFSTDSLIQHIQFVNKIQMGSKIPLFIGSNGAHCFPDFIKDMYPFVNEFPFEVITDDSILNEYASKVVKLNKTIGSNFLFVPEFSKKEYLSKDSLWLNWLAEKYLVNIKKLQANNILSCVSGFGQTNDTLIQKSTNSVYRKLINEDIAGICMSDEYRIKIQNKLQPIKSFLRNNLHFEGLLVRKISEEDKNYERKIFEFFSNETDMILTNGNIENVVKKIKNKILEKTLDINLLNKKVRRILLAKSWVGLEKKHIFNVDSVKKIMNSISSKSLSGRMKAASIILAKNEHQKIPFTDINQDFNIYTFCDTGYNAFIKQFEFYAGCEHNIIGTNAKLFVEELVNTNVTSVIIIDSIPENIRNEFSVVVNQIEDKSNIIFVNFGKPENLNLFEKFPVLIHAYNKSAEMQSLVVQLIFGGISAKGKLPFSISNTFKYGIGVINTPITRLSYTIPEEARIDAEMLNEIDDIAKEAISEHGTPGCQIFVAKDGKVIYNKCFGNHTYDSKQSVKWNDLYDIASVTKVAATTLAVMKMYDDTLLSLENKIGEYFIDTIINYTRIKPDTIVRIDTFKLREIRLDKKLVADKDTVYINDSTVVAYDTIISKVTPQLNIFQIALKDLMIHKSGLPPSMPVLRYVQYRKDKFFFNEKPLKFKKDSMQYLFNKFYSRKYINDSAEVEIADNFYLRKPYVDTLWNDIKQIKVYTKSVYMYSDVNMNLVQKVVDTINGYGINKYLDTNFYKPLGLRHTCYKPTDLFSKEQIVPTAEDKFWREQLMHGHVHDPAAAMLGGVAGNAGLFSCANDLGVLFQMLINKGSYGGVRYLDSNTVKKFTTRQYDSYRGLGFDLVSGKGINAADASSETYGHTGFTGTCVWADPKNKLVYVFLSNRINPSEKNWKLNSLEVRQRIHQVVYDAIKNSKDQ